MQISLWDFHYCDFSRHSKNVWLRRFQGYLFRYCNISAKNSQKIPLFFFAIARLKNCRIKLENCKEFAVLAVEHVLSLSELGSRILCVSEQQPKGSKYFWWSILIFLHIMLKPFICHIQNIRKLKLMPFQFLADQTETGGTLTVFNTPVPDLDVPSNVVL